jgi:uncharacterized sulfatase
VKTPVSLVSIVLPLLLASGAAGAPKPNILFVIADDCTYRDIGCYGGQAHTPHIDALAEQGMRFTRCFQAAPMCSPTRHNIYTGLYPVKSGAYPNHTTVAPGTGSIVQYMQGLGYRVGQSGKTHVRPHSVFAWERLHLDPSGKGGSNPDWEATSRFLAECAAKEQPFCLLLCSNEPHAPWDKGDASRYPPDQLRLPPYFADTPVTRESLSRYLAEVTYFDSQVGQALALLKKHGQATNTLVMVVSEQGSSFPFAKWTCYDHGLQSACIVRWPGKVEPGSVNPAMIEYVDILPTFIEAGGGTPDASLDGRSLLPVLAGKKAHKDHVFAVMTTRGINNGSAYYGIRSVRSGRYKYIWNLTPEVRFQNACVKSPVFRSWEARAAEGDQKSADLVRRYTVRPGVEFYDLQEDPMELVNLADRPEHRQAMGGLRARLEQWMAACGDQGQTTELRAFNHMPGRRQGAERKNKKRRGQP